MLGVLANTDGTGARAVMGAVGFPRRRDVWRERPTRGDPLPDSRGGGTQGRTTATLNWPAVTVSGTAGPVFGVQLPLPVKVPMIFVEVIDVIDTDPLVSPQTSVAE